MKPSSLAFGVKQSIHSLRKNTLMSVASILTVALSLMVAGIFGLIAINLGHLAATVESQVEVTAYLADNLNEAALQGLKGQIQAIPGVSEVKYVTKAEALERLKAMFADDKDLLAEVELQNPLYNSFEIRTARSDQIKPVADAVSKLSGVTKVNYKQDLVEKLFRVTRALRVSGFVIMLGLILAMIMIISNTIRITVFARRREIGIMKLVGATDNFIRWPFVCEGIILGMVGSILTAMGLWLIYTWAWYAIQDSLPFIPLVPRQPLLIEVTGLVLGAGAAVGAIGSAISLRRFLRV